MLKNIFIIISAIIGIIAFFPYLRDIFLFKTRPHIYTWLIWTLTQSIAIMGILLGGGGWGALNLYLGTIFVFMIFLFSIKYGTKNITKGDTIVLILALLAIIVWWLFNQPVISIIMVSVIDVLGYIPSFRKSYKEPWSETLITWLAFSISNIFAILALSEYNLLTTLYLISITFASFSLFLFCIFRRKFIPKLKN